MRKKEEMSRGTLMAVYVALIGALFPIAFVIAKGSVVVLNAKRSGGSDEEALGEMVRQWLIVGDSLAFATIMGGLAYFVVWIHDNE
jgi:hypothetical protein